jgi:hypothetical protein
LNTDLTKLDPEECQNISEKGKSKSLIQAYRVAAEAHDIGYFKSMLLDHQKALQEDQELQEAREAAKAEKAARGDKKKRKSEVQVDEDEDGDVDMDEGDEEVKPPTNKSPNKRKKGIESEGEDDQVCFHSPNLPVLVLTSLVTLSLQRRPRRLPN